MTIKLKTRKAALKRIKQSKNCLLRKKAYRSHFLRRKTGSQLRKLSQIVQIHPADKKNILFMLPYKK